MMLNVHNTLLARKIYDQYQNIGNIYGDLGVRVSYTPASFRTGSDRQLLEERENPPLLTR